MAKMKIRKPKKMKSMKPKKGKKPKSSIYLEPPKGMAEIAEKV
jgi:hypothetical protein